MIAWTDLSIKYLSDLLLENVAKSNFSATSWKQLVACGNFRATSVQHVESNLLKATCCPRQHLSNFWSTCWKQLVERNLLNVCSSMLLVATCWSNMLPKIRKVESLATCCWINYDNEQLQYRRAEHGMLIWPIAYTWIHHCGIAWPQAKRIGDSLTRWSTHFQSWSW
jgi:hypothetical protein